MVHIFVHITDVIVDIHNCGRRRHLRACTLPRFLGSLRPLLIAVCFVIRIVLLGLRSPAFLRGRSGWYLRTCITSRGLATSFRGSFGFVYRLLPLLILCIMSPVFGDEVGGIAGKSMSECHCIAT